MKFLLERGISQENMPEKFLASYERLEATRWICIALILCWVNVHSVGKLYTNLHIVYLSNPNLVIRIKGKEVNFGDEQINGAYGLEVLYIMEYEVKDVLLGVVWLSIYSHGERSHWVPLRLGY